MKVDLEKTYPLPAPAEAAWTYLQDIPSVAACMPGAKITERIDDTHYKGTVSVRVGPAVMAFRGEIEVKELDSSSKRLHLIGKGSDTSGSSGASMDLVATIEPADQGSQLKGRSEVTVSGKAASFGGRMMTTVADQILGQFAANLAKALKAQAPAAAPTAAAATSAAPAAENGEPAVAEPLRRTVPPVPPRPPSAAAAVGVAFAPAPPPEEAVEPAISRAPADPQLPPTVLLRNDEPPAAGEINAMSLLWAVIRDWFRGLFRRRPA